MKMKKMTIAAAFAAVAAPLALVAQEQTAAAEVAADAPVVVEATVDCTGLLPRTLRDDRTDVLNGIAVNDGKIYLTG